MRDGGMARAPMGPDGAPELLALDDGGASPRAAGPPHRPLGGGLESSPSPSATPAPGQSAGPAATFPTTFPRPRDSIHSERSRRRLAVLSRYEYSASSIISVHRKRRRESAELCSVRRPVAPRAVEHLMGAYVYILHVASTGHQPALTRGRSGSGSGSSRRPAHPERASPSPPI